MTDTANPADHSHGGVFAGLHAHDGGEPHWHDEFGEHADPLTDLEAAQLQEHLWKLDNVRLTTVGVDVGSSTSHLMFSRVHLQRIGQGLSTRFVVVARETLYKSPILLTPYLADNTIDVGRLRGFVQAAYRQAGLARADIDSGAIILTGEALKRRNARAIAELFAEESGKFVCASAGHHLEARLAAHGSGTVARSRRDHQTLLNVDIGGGACKLALVRAGEVLATAAVAIGGRLLVRGESVTPSGPDGAADASAPLVRIDGPARQAAQSLGIRLELGEPLAEADEQRLVRQWVDILAGLIRQETASGLAAELMLTEPLPSHVRPQALTFSGGVSEYIYFRERATYGGLGPALARELRRALADGRIPYPVVDPGQGIRATAIGASQFTVQVSGNTIRITNERILPLHNIPVVDPHLDLGSDPGPAEVAVAIREAARRLDLEEGAAPLALAFRWQGDPLYARLLALAQGVRAALPRSIERRVPLILMTDRDLGRTLGQVLKEDLGVPGELVSLDGLVLQEFDYVDVGEVIRPAGVIPVVIKSLLFAGGMDRTRVAQAAGDASPP